MEILLNSKRNIHSVNTDTHLNIELYNKESILTEYDVRTEISSSDLFDKEREENSIYRIYGKFEYVSLLNYMKSNYINLSSFFIKDNINPKTLINSFDFYLLKASTKFTNIPNTDNYIRNFDVIATPDDFEFYNAGFNTNVFNEQLFSFTISKDINIDEFYNDQFNMPHTQLFIYCKYIPMLNGMTPAIPETMSGTTWNSNGIENIESLNYPNIITGTTIKGDLINYLKTNFEETTISAQTYYITTGYLENNETKYLQWKYNPFIPIRLRYLTDTLYNGSKNNTSIDVVDSIPDYATNINENNFIWRNIVPQGYLDPVSGNGVDYPFINKKRYLFSNLTLDMKPDMDHKNTNDVFFDISFKTGDNYIKNYKPKGSINNIAKLC